MRLLIKASAIVFFLVLNTLGAFAQQQAQPYLQLLSRWEADPATLHTYNDIWGWTSYDQREYAIIGTLDSIFFIEITDPENPILRDAEAGKYNFCVHRDFKTYKNYCYAVADEGSSSLQIFDMKYLPDSVHKVYDSDTLTTRSHNIFIENGRIYFASNKISTPQIGFFYHSMTVASLADPEVPKVLSHLDGSGQNPSFNEVHDVFVKNDTAYCSNGTAGLFIYDYTDPKQPKFIKTLGSNYPHAGYNHSGWLAPDGKSFVFADETHGKALKLYDVSGIKTGGNGNLQFKNLFGIDYERGSISHNPFVKGSYVYVSYYHEGLVVFDISDPTGIKIVAQYDTYPQNDSNGNSTYKGYEGCWGTYPFFPSGTIVASDVSNGLFVFKLKDQPKDSAPEPDKPETFDPGYVVLENPFGSRGIRIQYRFEESTEAELVLYDILGRVVWHEMEEVAFELREYDPAQIVNLKRGEYILRVRTGSEIKVFKLIKW